MTALVYLKLGGSLITDKNNPHTANLEAIHFLAQELKAVLKNFPDLQVVLGHGSGSFGHVPASKYRTRQGVNTPGEWQGFVEVWTEASALNRIVVEQFLSVHLPVVSLPPSASLTSANGQVEQWNITPIADALDHALIPVIYGDVIFDRISGGTIFSTEQLFIALAGFLLPERVLIAGSEPGVWADFPTCTQLIPEITPASHREIAKKVFPSSSVDVTGGMAGKVESMVALVNKFPGVQVNIFNPSPAGTIENVLNGKRVGTLIHADGI